MAGAVDNEDRATTVAAMYDNEASAEDYGDGVEDVMGGGGSGGSSRRGGRGGRGLDEDDDDNDGDGSSDDDNGSNDNDETPTTTRTVVERAVQRGRGRRRTLRL